MVFSSVFKKQFFSSFLGDITSASIEYLLRDEFTTDDPAPIISPRTCEPGPGTLVFSDAGGYYSVAGDKLATVTSALFTSFMRSPSTFVFAPGQAFGIKIDSLVRVEFILNVSTAFAYNGLAAFERTGPAQARRLSGLYDGIHAGTADSYIIIMRSGGGALFVKGTKFLKAIPGVQTAQYINHTASASTYDWLRVAQLSGAWAGRWDLATNYIASPSAGQTTTSEANAQNDFRWTPNAGETLDFAVRRTDDNNCWIIRGSQSGSTVKLIQKQDGVETERSSAAQTWSVGTQYEIAVQQDGNSIKTWVAGTAKNTYASATFNNTATGVNVSLAGADLACWPIYLSGAALAEIQRYFS